MDWQRGVESGEQVVIGVNTFQIDEPRPTIFRPDSSAKDQVLTDLADVRRERDAARVEGTMRALDETARGGGNLMEAIVDCVDAYGTIGEVCKVLEDVFGKYKAPRVL